MRLSDLKTSEEGIILNIQGRGAFRKRITEMGFVKGKKVTVIKNAPLKDPIEYNIMGYEISLRRKESSLIEVSIPSNKNEQTLENYSGTFSTNRITRNTVEKGKTIKIALVGNPNSGKTTLFNFASNSKEHVGNYGGVTIDSKTAHFKYNNYQFNITDLPGTYSLTAYTPEELYVRKFIFEETPDIIINVIDASNLERNLYLTTQLIDMDLKVIVALNMYDDLLKNGDVFDYQMLGKMIGIPFIPTISYKGTGLKDLFAKAIDVYEEKDTTIRHIHINYGSDIESSIRKIQEKIRQSKEYSDIFSSRFYAIKLIEKDTEAVSFFSNWENEKEIKSISNTEIKKIEAIYNEDSETLITDAKYGFISGALKETFSQNSDIRRKLSIHIDQLITSRILGFPIFIFFMWLMFHTTFKLGSYPMEWIDSLLSLVSNQLQVIITAGPLKDLLINGIINGVGGVLVFLPNILILFFFISLMEDTGYMARTAFIMDKLMHKIGLHGQSFIPLLMGFGCNVPAIMSTRTIRDKNSRLLTILINPLMSCSARLPVYVLLISAFFPNYAGTVLFSIYFLGILLAIGVAIIFKKFLLKTDESPFVMELPPYRIPTIKSITRHMWFKASEYLSKIGGVILISSIIIWALEYFPRNVEYSKNYDQLISTTEISYNIKIQNTNKLNTHLINQLENEKEVVISTLLLEKESERKSQSYIGRLGRSIEPIIKPLGFEWRMGVSLLAGLAAKEIVVSTMAVLYQINTDTNETSQSLGLKLKSEKNEMGKPLITPIIALAFMIFILIYSPCIGTIVTIKKETGSIKWMLFTISYTTILAWTMSFLVYTIGNLIF